MGQSGGGGGQPSGVMGMLIPSASGMPPGPHSLLSKGGGGAGPDIGAAAPPITALQSPLQGLSFGGTQPMPQQGAGLLPDLLRYLQPTFR